MFVRTSLRPWTLGTVAAAALGIYAIPGAAQETLPKKPSPVAAPDPARPGQPPATGREKVQEKAQEARDAAKGARENVQDTRRDARETVRDARADVREARREARQNWRAADLGLWFNRRAGARGLVIADVAPQGAIAKSGFQEGDQIVSVNGAPVATEAEFTRLLTDESVRDQQLKVAVMRNGKEQTITVQPSQLMQDVAAYDPLWQYGLVVDDRANDRIVVQRVYPRTPAYYAGLRAGDTVVGVRGQRIAAIADLVRALAQNADRLALQINRGNQTRELELENHANFNDDVQTTLKPPVDAEGRPLPAPADQRPRINPPEPARPAAPTPATPKPATPKPATPSPTTTPPARTPGAP